MKTVIFRYLSRTMLDFLQPLLLMLELEKVSFCNIGRQCIEVGYTCFNIFMCVQVFFISIPVIGNFSLFLFSFCSFLRLQFNKLGRRFFVFIFVSHPFLIPVFLILNITVIHVEGSLSRMGRVFLFTDRLFNGLKFLSSMQLTVNSEN
uniref:Uncharacterized protein n=1 Tax=Cacopsylla melanoneura TaxID=428564 RepID=A0A8D9E2M0_9HEMI